jgi:hypothetical protein
MGSRVLVLRVARAGDVGYDPNQDKVVVRFEDGTEKAVLRGKLNDGSKAKTDLVGNPTVDEAGAQGVGRHDPVPA